MIYCYACKCGNKTEKILPSSQSKRRFKCLECGKMMVRDLKAEHKGFADRPGKWPMESDAAGVHPDQVPEAVEYAMQMGVPTDYNLETGNPIFTSQKHRKKFCRISGLYDRNAGYGDATPVHNMRKRKARAKQ